MFFAFSWTFIGPLVDSFFPINADVSNSCAYAETKKTTKKRTKRKKRVRKTRTSSRKKSSTVTRLIPELGKSSDSFVFAEEASKDEAIDAILLLDSSGSMQRNGLRNLRDQGAKLFTRFLSARDRIAIFEFDKETRLILDFTEVTPENLNKIEQAIERVSAEGTHTDLEAPVRAAFQLFDRGGRKESTKSVILLSDGKMDPHKSRGSAEALTKELFEHDLSLLRRNSIQLFSLSLSKDTDKELLAKLALKANGLHWYAPDMNTIHQSFSELFLALKNPQYLPIEGEGFEIDSDTEEVTFYVARKDNSQDVVLVNPRGIRISNTSIPSDVKWFKGEMFDIITIKNPKAGMWSFQGVDELDSFATLLSNIKLQVHWPKTNLTVGEEARIIARLVEDGKLISKPGIDDVSYYNYKIINTATGQKVASGSLKDKGSDGDEVAGDNVYSAVVKLDQEGDYKAFASAITPTFSRRQVVNFIVSRGLVFLHVDKGVESEGIPPAFIVKLGRGTRSLDNIKLQVVAQNIGNGELIEVPSPSIEPGSDVYTIPTDILTSGAYRVVVHLTANTESGNTVKESSDIVDFISVKSAVPEIVKEESKIEESVEESSSAPIMEVISLVLSLVWCGVFVMLISSRFSVDEELDVEIKEYNPPAELTKRLDDISKKASSTKRELSPEEAVLFELSEVAVKVAQPDEAQANENQVEETQVQAEEVQAEEENVPPEEPEGDDEVKTVDEEVAAFEEKSGGEEESESNDESKAADESEGNGEVKTADEENEEVGAKEEKSEVNGQVKTADARETVSPEELEEVDKIVEEINAEG